MNEASEGSSDRHAGKVDPSTSLSLLERLRDSPSDPAAWSEFVRRYGPMIRAWCLAWGLQPADADDVTQAVLTRLLESIRKYRYDPGHKFRSWLKTVTHHVWMDLTARQRQIPPGTVRGASLVENLAAREDLQKRLADAFDTERLEWAAGRARQRVAAATWEAFRLTAVEGLTGAEAARRLGMPVAHVFVAKHRVQKIIKEELRRAGDPDAPGPPTPGGPPPGG